MSCNVEPVSSASLYPSGAVTIVQWYDCMASSSVLEDPSIMTPEVGSLIFCEGRMITAFGAWLILLAVEIKLII